jgi:peptidoglycan/LPS O-acetylase OafA/YrhL
MLGELTQDAVPMVAGRAQEAAVSRQRAHHKPVFYRPELDALRFAAFLFVFLHHALFTLDPSRYTGLKAVVARATQLVREDMAFGVSLFFFLSAYLITTLLLKERNTTGTIHIRRFYIRRILRIWPLYFTYIVVALIIGYFAQAPTPKRQVLALFLLMGNWYTAKYDWQGATAFAVFWSISVEEQFYLFWPALAKLLTRRRLFFMCSLFAAISVCLVYWLKLRGVGWYYGIWTNSFSQLQFFAFGGMLAIVLHQREFRPSWKVRVLLVLAGFVCWFGSQARPTLPASPFAVSLGYVLVAVGCTCFFLSIFGVQSKYVPRWAIYLGKCSYGLYIFHGVLLHYAGYAGVYLAHAPAIYRWTAVFFADLLALGMTILVASISYRYLEEPWLRMKAKYEYINTRTIGVPSSAASS